MTCIVRTSLGKNTSCSLGRFARYAPRTIIVSKLIESYIKVERLTILSVGISTNTRTFTLRCGHYGIGISVLRAQFRKRKGFLVSCIVRASLGENTGCTLNGFGCYIPLTVVVTEFFKRDIKVECLTILGIGVSANTSALALRCGHYGIGISVLRTQFRKCKGFLMSCIIRASLGENTGCTLHRICCHSPLTVVVTKFFKRDVKVERLTILGIGISTNARALALCSSYN